MQDDKYIDNIKEAKQIYGQGQAVLNKVSNVIEEANIFVDGLADLKLSLASFEKQLEFFNPDK